jgi:hypothetical protein
MGILQEVFNALQAFEITKIDGQPTDDDINRLTTQLTAALVTISTGNGGGKLGTSALSSQKADMSYYPRATNLIDQFILEHTRQPQVTTRKFVREKSRSTKRK